jgi:hypothetical protein
MSKVLSAGDSAIMAVLGLEVTKVCLSGIGGKYVH